MVLFFCCSFGQTKKSPSVVFLTFLSEKTKREKEEEEEEEEKELLLFSPFKNTHEFSPNSPHIK